MSAIWKIKIGQKITSDGKPYEITRFLDSGSILAKNLESSKFEKLFISEIHPATAEIEDVEKINSSPAENEEVDLGSVPADVWDEAERRAEHVKRILQMPRPTRADVEAEAKLLGVSAATLYRYINTFVAAGKVSSLIPNSSNGGRGRTRIGEESEAVIEAVINEEYLSTQKLDPQKVIREYQRRCFNAGIEPAHDNTLRNRIDEITQKDKVKSRQGRNALRGLLPLPGKFPEGSYPFQVVQIDHTPVDLQFVDDVTREPIGRLWLTVMIEVYSRMILGFYLSPDAPSVNSIGLCMAHAVLPKEKELLRLEVQNEWNCWGLMNKMHADNGSDFRSAAFQRACREYGIDVEWRPVGRPHFGAHIERLLGTFMREVHGLRGTTFSNIREKGDNKPEKEAVFTYTEFEKWLTIYITGVYHKKRHDGIGMAPEVKFERGLYIGDDEFGPTGPPAKIMDERKFRIDFMPTIERTVQPFGVEIDYVQYYDSVLNPYIGAKNPVIPKYARKFVFKRNPRETKKIYFYHPELKQYFDIPYRNLANPPATVWELKAARQKLKNDGVKVESEEQIFEALNQMKEVESAAIKETKTTRRNAQKQRIYDEQEKRNNISGTPEPNDPIASGKPDKAKSDSVKSGSHSDFFNISEDEITPSEVEDF